MEDQTQLKLVVNNTHKEEIPKDCSILESKNPRCSPACADFEACSIDALFARIEPVLSETKYQDVIKQFQSAIDTVNAIREKKHPFQH